MLSLAELRRVVAALGERVGARIDKVVQPDPAEVVLHLSGGQDLAPDDRMLLLLSANPKHARLSALPRGRKALPQPLAFAQYLKAHLDGGRLRAIALEGEDRQVRLRVETREGRFSILVSILGPRSNCYVLDGGDRIVATARALADTRRDLSLGDVWASPASGAPREGEDRFASAEGRALLDAIEAHYAAQEGAADERQLATRVAKALKKRSGSLEKKLRLLEADLAAGEEAPRLERLGELLKTRMRDVKAGMTEVAVPDFETGEPVTIPLEPKLSPQKNMERLFQRARKAEKRARKAAGDIDITRERFAYSEALRAEVADATPERLAEIAEDPEVARLLERYFPDPKPSSDAPVKKKIWKIGKRELPTRLVPKRYLTESGLEVWVGKNDEGNDILTTRLARGNDLFFHLEGDPGSHVVLRTQGANPPPDDAILDAAELAVNFSKAKKASRAPVHIAEIKDISKPSGAKPGLVYVHRGRTIQLKRSPERLARILAARLDD